jgi:chorismate mutase
MSTSSFMRRAGQAARGVVRMPPRAERSSTRSAQRGFAPDVSDGELVDLTRRRDQLKARVAELQWDLGGLVYEMAIRDRIRVEVLVRRAAELQNADGELNEVERILRLEETATAGQCASCAAPHSTGAAYCWQCGQPLLREVQHNAIGTP